MSTDLAKMLLGLERGTLSKDVISKAFKEKSRVCHPDTGGDEDLFKGLVSARDLLLEEMSRPTPQSSSKKTYHSYQEQGPLDWQTRNDYLWCGTKFRYDTPEEARIALERGLLNELNKIIYEKFPTKRFNKMNITIASFENLNAVRGNIRITRNKDNTLHVNVSTSTSYGIQFSLKQLTVLAAEVVKYLIEGKINLSTERQIYTFQHDVFFGVDLEIKNPSFLDRLKKAWKEYHV